MSNYIIGATTSNITDTNMTTPEFRNTSLNMALAHSVLGKIFTSNISLLDFLKQNTTGIFIATSHGELQCSKDFLRSIAIDGIARPILFQNSLHNSILGFVTKAYGLTGPSFTVSSQYFSGEDALCLACDLLDSQIIQYALVVGVDTIPAGIEPLFSALYREDIKLVEGAGALLLTNEQNLAAISHYATPKALINDIKYNRGLSSTGTRVPSSKKGYYDANAIEELARALGTNNANVEIEKPDGTSSSYSLEFRL